MILYGYYWWKTSCSIAHLGILCLYLSFISLILLTLGNRKAKELLEETKTTYDGILDIADELILVDAREERSEGMTRLRNVLKRLRMEIVVSCFHIHYGKFFLLCRSSRQSLVSYSFLSSFFFEFFLSSSGNISETYISGMPWLISTRLGHKNPWLIAFMSYGVKGHVGVTGVKKVKKIKTMLLLLLQITTYGHVTHI